MTRRRTARRRAAVAYDVLRGRPVRLDYGVLVVLPVLAAAGGALLGWGAETIVTRRRPVKPDTAAPATADRHLAPVSV